MADETLTEAQLLARLNTRYPFAREGDAGSFQITVQDLRDIVVSLSAADAAAKVYGGLYITAPAAGQATVTDESEDLVGWDTEVDGGITPTDTTGLLTCVTAGDYQVTANIDFALGSAGTTTIQFAVDGAEEGPLAVVVSAGTETQRISLSYIATLAAAQDLSIRVVTAADETITVASASFEAVLLA
jgi:hypothetical protein